MTKTREVWLKHENQFKKNMEEYERIAREEFPPGTKVRWISAYWADEPAYLSGEIVEICSGMAHILRETGATFRQKPHRLEKV